MTDVIVGINYYKIHYNASHHFWLSNSVKIIFGRGFAPDPTYKYVTNGRLRFLQTS